MMKWKWLPSRRAVPPEMPGAWIIFLGLVYPSCRGHPHLRKRPSSQRPRTSPARPHRWAPASAPSLERSPGTPRCPAPHRAAAPCGMADGRLSAAGATGPAGRSAAQAPQRAAPQCSAGWGRSSGPGRRRRPQGPACRSASSGYGPADWTGKVPGDTGTIPQHPGCRQ